jgi:hypothetical protein
VGTLKYYDEINQGLQATLERANRKQSGDPERGVAKILDVIKGEGIAANKGKEYPARMPLGTDALECLRKNCNDTLKLLDDWESVIVSSDFPNGE